MCWDDGTFSQWEATGDTAANDTITTIPAWSWATDYSRIKWTLPEWTEKETKPKRKSKWMEKKLKRYDR